MLLRDWQLADLFGQDAEIRAERSFHTKGTPVPVIKLHSITNNLYYNHKFTKLCPINIITLKIGKN